MPSDEHAIAVVIAEANRLIRAGLRLLLEADGDIVVVGEATRGEDAVAEARRLRPEVVLMDAGVPGIGALRATRLLFEDGPTRARVVLLAASPGEADALAALRAGAHGVVLRDGEPQDLRRAARTVAAGGLLLTQGMTRRVAASLVSVHVGDGVVAPEVQVLTGREREVLGLVGHGFNNAEIGARLHISAATVKAHVGGMIAKLDARDRAALVTLAYETGLVLPAARRSRGAPLSGVRDERPDVGPSS